MMRLFGAVDNLDESGALSGWAYCPDYPEDFLKVSLVSDGQVLKDTIASIYRPDTGANAFRFDTSEIPSIAEKIINGNVVVEASILGDSAHIPIYHQLAESLNYSILLSKVKLLSKDNISRLVSEVDFREVARYQFSDLMDEVQQVSHFSLPVGLHSRDGVAVIGKMGDMFLVGGSNDLKERYFTVEADVENTVSSWAELFKKRQQLAQGMGIKYLQTVIPEKTSHLANSMPYPIPPLTTCMRMLEQHSKSDISAYRSVVSDLKACEQPYRKLDTHFTPHGAACFTRFALKSFGIDLTGLKVLSFGYDPLDHEINYYTGDLGTRFGELIEPLICPKTQNPAVLIKRTQSDRHLGSRFVWSNAQAPFQHKVVAFANSFFGTGHDSHEISWWFSLLFSEFHMIWDKEVDWEYVREVKPNLMICQTIERFLGILPND